MFAILAAVPPKLGIYVVILATLGILTISVFAPAEGATCKKFKNGMTISDCPDEGCGGKGANLNKVKNRHDHATSPGSMTLVEIVGLNSKIGSGWTEDMDRGPIEAVGEGKPVVIEGFLAGVRQEGHESCNCDWPRTENHDIHIWIAPKAKDGKKKAVVVEMAPRIVVDEWTARKIRKLLKWHKPHPRVRVTGWLMLDTFHVIHGDGGPRATLWEVHPVTAFEVLP